MGGDRTKRGAWANGQRDQALLRASARKRNCSPGVLSRVRLLPDPHVPSWWPAGDAFLSSVAMASTPDRRHEGFVSAASACETSTKHRIGKPSGAGPLVLDLRCEVVAHGFMPLPVTLEQGQSAGSLDWAHREPFDRLLVD